MANAGRALHDASFLDLYVIPTGIETLHNGGDPLAANPADPLHRSMNYPRVWLYLFSAAGITRGNVFRGWHSYSALSTWLHLLSYRSI